jgi:hypothetical protein
MYYEIFFSEYLRDYPSHLHWLSSKVNLSKANTGNRLLKTQEVSKTESHTLQEIESIGGICSVLKIWNLPLVLLF